MIAVWRDFAGAGPAPETAIAGALARYAAGPATLARAQATLLAAGPRDGLGAAGGVQAVLTGWIDNAAEVADSLALSPDTSPAMLYAAALARWGGEAERRLIGTYAAAAVLADGSLHLARTPWDAPPLYYHVGAGQAFASPLLRVLFAAGVPRRLDRDRIVDDLAYDWRSDEDSCQYHGVRIVPLGSHVTIAGDRVQMERWHRPPTPMCGADYREEEAVAEACRLLDEAAARALAWAGKPALSLSGGLDSPLLASALLRSLAPGERLCAITFRPDAAWRGASPPGTFGDEAALAGQFASAHPMLDWHCASRAIPPFDWRARELFAAMEAFPTGLANVAMLHRVYEKARELGCDSLLTADFGNATISDSGTAAYCEYARRGHWRQLRRLLAARADDDRPMWRRIAALSLLPHLPQGLRRGLRGLVHPRRRDMAGLVTALSPRAREAQRARARQRGSASAWFDHTYPRSRAAKVTWEWREADGRGKDCDLGFEQLYGVRKRDVLAYRPLVEFCMRLPTRAFAWDGTERRLARLMGRGRVPEAIRTNPLHGQHNVDWHERLTRERATLRAAFAAAADHPWLATTLDLPRLGALLDDWPDGARFTWEDDLPRRLALPRALLAARFIGHVEGSNAL